MAGDMQHCCTSSSFAAALIQPLHQHMCVNTCPKYVPFVTYTIHGKGQRMRLAHMLLNSMLPMLTDTSPARALLSGQASTRNRVLTHRAKAQAQLRGAATHATWVAPQHCLHTDNHTQQTHHGLHRGLAHFTSKPIYLPTYSACTLLCGQLEANRPGQLQTAQYHSRKPAADDAVYYLYI